MRHLNTQLLLNLRLASKTSLNTKNAVFNKHICLYTAYIGWLGKSLYRWSCTFHNYYITFQPQWHLNIILQSEHQLYLDYCSLLRYDKLIKLFNMSYQLAASVTPTLYTTIAAKKIRQYILIFWTCCGSISAPTPMSLQVWLTSFICTISLDGKTVTIQNVHKDFFGILFKYDNFWFGI